MQTFQSHEDGYHRCSVSINRGINGIQQNSVVEAVGASSLLENFLPEADQHVRAVLTTAAAAAAEMADSCHTRV